MPKERKVPEELKRLAEKRGDDVDKEDVEAWREGWRPGMDAREARAAGLDRDTFVSQEIEHHMEDLGMPQDQAVAVALSEARKGGYDVPPEKESGEES